MHIALVSPAWPASKYSNGIVTYIDELRKALVAEGQRVSIFTSELRSSAPESDVHLVEATMADRLRNKWQKISRPAGDLQMPFADVIAERLHREHRQDPFDIVEMEETFGWCGNVQKKLNIPVVVRLHGPAFLDLIEEDATGDGAQKRLDAEERGISKIAYLTSPAKATLDATVAEYHLSPSLAEVIASPMPIDESAGTWSLNECDPNTLLFVGRFDKRKGGDRALLVFKKLVQRHPKLRLVFAGPDYGLTQTDGSRMHFDEFKALHFSASEFEKISYLNQVPRQKIFELRRNALATMVLSRWDNQPNTALEAMMQGCPVVAFATGGVGEIIADGVTGLLAPDGDMDALCAQLTRLIETPAMAAELGANARKYIADRHCPTTVARLTLDFYRRAVAGGNSGV